MYQICLDQVFTIYNNNTEIDSADIVVKLKNKPKSQVIVILGHNMKLYQFFKQTERYRLTDKTWISSSHHWLTSRQINSIDPELPEGAIIVLSDSTLTQSFENYLNQLNFCNNIDNTWFMEAWHQKIIAQGLDWDKIRKNCTINDSWKNKYFSGYYDINPLTAFVIDATLALAYALHNYLGCNLTSCPSIDNNSFNNQQFNRHLRQIQFDDTSSRNFQFASDGSRLGSLCIVNLQLFANAKTLSIQPIKVGY